MSQEVFGQDMRRAYLFSGLEDSQYQEIMAHAKPVELAAGQSLFAQGDPVTGFYWVVEGLIRLYRSSPQGDEKVIELIGPGRFFAEAALFMGGRFPVNAAAQTTSRLIAIDSTSFRAWLAQDASRCFKLMAGMSARLHKLVNEIDSLALMKGTDRLLQYLIDHSDPDESGQMVVELEAPKQVIASRIGVKPETLSRLLHKLTDLGYIEMKDNTLLIKDSEALRSAGLE
ncbi:MAG: Crp/Fnr family transcriptional regulator [Parasulfuritortus sp.]|nr:Crp/Fnr family transcriptional regulator [Parasulfuritortus sp.]